jgi:hypothetical protein
MIFKWWQKLNQISCVIYQKIEHWKLIKMHYLHIIFLRGDQELFVKYCSWSTIFWVKNKWTFSSILAPIHLRRMNPNWILDMLYSFSPSTKWLKKSFKKIGTVRVKMDSHYSHITTFWWFFNKNKTFLPIFSVMTQMYSKMNMVFRISAKNCIETYRIWKKQISVRNLPVVPYSPLF